MKNFSPNPSQEKVIASREALCVVAGAGSGKTGSLVAALVERLAEKMNDAPPFSVQNLMALTFTEKAAAELRQRLGAAFQAKAKNAPFEAPFWRSESSRLDRADIGTIHGYALKLVRENALALALPPDLKIEDGDAFFERDLRGVITDWLDEKDGDLLWLLDKMPLAQLSEMLAVSARAMNSWGLGELFAEVDAPEVSEAALRDFRALARKALDFVENGDLNRARPYYEKVRSAMLLLNDDLARPWDRGRLGARVAGWRNIIKDGGSWFTKGGKPVKEELKNAADALRAANDAFLAAPAKARILRLARRLPDCLESRKKGRGAIDFDDILILARRLLAQNPEARRKEIESHPLIVIDEFQDTNRLQADILAYLLLDPSDARVFPENHNLWRELPWAELAPRLNVFGDLKQSIYRFRGAEPEVMRSLAHSLAGGGGAVLALDYNYRSQEALIAFFNAFFAERLDFTERDRQKATRPDLYEGPHVVLLRPSEEAPRLLDKKAELAALALRRYLSELFSGERGVLIDDGQGGARPPGPGDVAVLFRKKRRGRIFREALQKAWPCQTAFGDSPFRYAEVKALVAAFKYLSGLDEEISLAGALRSPLGPVSDAALLALARPAGEKRRVSLTEYFAESSRPWPDNLLPDDLEILEELKELFRKMRSLLGRVPPVEILEMAVEERGLIPFALLEPDGEERARAITALLAASRSLARDESEGRGAAEELSEMAEGWKAPGEGEERLNPAAIKLMTVHGAKGLEFPVVVVAEADAPFKSHVSPVIISREGRLAISFTDDDGLAVTPSDYLELKEEEENKAREEEGRLLYVAATRARDHLIFLGWPKAAAKGEAGDEGKQSWFESVARCEAARPYVDFAQYGEEGEAPEPPPAPPEKAAARPAEAAPWPLDLLPPVELAGHTLSVTALSLLLVSPEKFYREHHLGLARDFSFAAPEKADEKAAPEILSEGLSRADRGALFHAALEKIDLADIKIQAVLRREAELLGLEPREREFGFLGESLAAFLEGPLGRAWRKARQLNLAEYREAAFRLAIDGPSRLGSLAVSGRIDLFHLTPEGGGRIVDYKFTAPKFENGQPGPELMAYEIQVRVYAQALKAAGFSGPLAAFLYFAGGGKPYMHEVELASPDPLSPLLPRLHELWPLLDALRPLQSNRPGVFSKARAL